MQGHEPSTCRRMIALCLALPVQLYSELWRWKLYIYAAQQCRWTTDCNISGSIVFCALSPHDAAVVSMSCQCRANVKWRASTHAWKKCIMHLLQPCSNSLAIPSRKFPATFCDCYCLLVRLRQQLQPRLRLRLRQQLRSRQRPRLNYDYDYDYDYALLATNE